METAFVNKVAESGIVSIDLEEFLPKTAIVPFDLQPHLFMGLILKEKDFRAALQVQDWSGYTGKVVAVFCSADAIIPLWAYMLVAVHLKEHAADVVFGTEAQVREQLLLAEIARVDAQAYSHKRVVIKGCGDEGVPASAYTAISWKLLPVVRSLMFGEPCSTVPLYKRKNNAAGVQAAAADQQASTAV